MNNSNDSGRSTSRRVRRAVLLLLIVPFIGTLWVGSYTSITPELWGIPFFYWYQFLWIAISAAITIIVYLLEGGGRKAGETHADGSDNRAGGKQ